MADIAMCASTTCPRRLACVRNEQAGVYEVNPHRQSFGGYSLVDGHCQGYTPVTGLLRPTYLYATVPVELWESVDSDIRDTSIHLAVAALPLSFAMAWSPEKALAVAGVRRTLLTEATG